MSYQYFNPNPSNNNVGDCTIRALCAALNCDWDTAYIKTALRGFILHER